MKIMKLSILGLISFFSINAIEDTQQYELGAKVGSIIKDDIIATIFKKALNGFSGDEKKVIHTLISSMNSDIIVAEEKVKLIDDINKDEKVKEDWEKFQADYKEYMEQFSDYANSLESEDEAKSFLNEKQNEFLSQQDIKDAYGCLFSKIQEQQQAMKDLDDMNKATDERYAEFFKGIRSVITTSVNVFLVKKMAEQLKLEA